MELDLQGWTGLGLVYLWAQMVYPFPIDSDLGYSLVKMVMVKEMVMGSDLDAIEWDIGGWV